MMDDRINDLAALLDGQVQAIEPALIAIRRDIHAHPELGMDTPRTAALVAAELKRIGLLPRTGVGGHGVTAEIGENDIPRGLWPRSARRRFSAPMRDRRVRSRASRAST